jgi:hypothetical protein
MYWISMRDIYKLQLHKNEIGLSDKFTSSFAELPQKKKIAYKICVSNAR